MSEKRFRITTTPKSQSVAFDEKQKKHYIGIDLEDLLNEQQTEITELREAIDYLKTVIRYTIPNEMVADVFKQIGEEYE